MQSSLAYPVKPHQLVLNNHLTYSYSIKPIEIDNILSTAVVNLLEYSIQDKLGNSFKLYKTQGGNWYDIPDVNTTANSHTLALLKSGIDLKTRMAE